MVYLDNAATTRVSEKALEAMTEVMRESWGNASSVHGMGIAAKEEIEKARGIIGNCIGIDADRILFTSGATEANNAVMNHYATNGEREGKKHLLLSAIEHPSILEYGRYLAEQRGFELSIVYPSNDGIIDPFEVKRMIRKDTCMTCVMAVNNEIGTIQPFEDIYLVCKEHGVPYHCDMTQGVLFAHNIYAMDEASFSFSAHKFHGPKGVGALILPDSIRHFHSFLHGGYQEDYRRAGTENVEGIVGMAIAFVESQNSGKLRHEANNMRHYFFTLIDQMAGGIVINGNYSKSVPNILNVYFEGVNGEELVSMLSNVYNVFCSTGSACCSGDSKPSHVLKALGFSDERALNSVRFSFSRYTTKEELDYASDSLLRCISRLRS